MSNEEETKRMVTSKLTVDVHMAAKILAQRYKKQGRVAKGKRVSLSDALRFFIEEYEPQIMEAAGRMTDEQAELAGDE